MPPKALPFPGRGVTLPSSRGEAGLHLGPDARPGRATSTRLPPELALSPESEAEAQLATSPP